MRDAVFEVATTLRDVQDLVPPEKRAGLLADEVTVVFNVAATSSTTSSANLNISNVLLPNGTLAGGASTENTSDGTRGNQITIKFKNIATSDMTKGALSLKQFQTAGAGAARRTPTSSGATSASVNEQIRNVCKVLSEICVMNKGVLQIDNDKLRIQQQKKPM